MAERIYPDERPLFTSPASAPASVAAPPKQHEQFIYNLPNNNFIYRPTSAYPPPPLPPPPPRHRRSRTFCSCFCAVFAASLILLGIAVLIFYLVVQPRAPKYTVQDVQIREFSLNNNRTSALGGPYLTSDVVFTVNARNPNKKIGIYYDDVDVLFSYEGDVIGSGLIPSFYQGHKNTTVLVVTVQGRDAPLDEYAGSNLRSALADRSSIFLRARIGGRIRLKIGGWKTKHMKVVVRCDMEISSPSNTSSERVLSKTCKLRRFRF